MDAYNVVFNCLNLHESKNSYTANLLVIDNEVVGNNDELSGYGFLHKAKIVTGALHIQYGPKVREIALIDKFVTFYRNGTYRVTVTVNKMKSKPKTCLDSGCGSGSCY